MIQRSEQRYSNMLWNMWSIIRHKRSNGHPLHPDLTPDVFTCVLPLGTVSLGRESEVESAHIYLTIIQFFSACHLTSQHMSTCIHNSIISHSPTHYKSPVRCLINKGDSHFVAKRICEAERKREERKARAKGPSPDSAQSEFTCSICNRQFRAKIGL